MNDYFSQDSTQFNKCIRLSLLLSNLMADINKQLSKNSNQIIDEEIWRPLQNAI